MTDMQFIVTLAGVSPSLRMDQHQATNAIFGKLAATEIHDSVDHIAVRPMPDLGADDTHLQIGFRRLRASLCNWGPGHDPDVDVGIMLTRHQVAALIAELSKQHPARTGHVDQAALDAVRAIRESDKRPGQQVQKNARAQLIITDAICRCVPAES